MAPILRQAGFAGNRLARIDDQQLLYKLPPEDIWGHDHIKTIKYGNFNEIVTSLDQFFLTEWLWTN